MIVTEESNNEILRMNSDSTICDKNQEFKFNGFAEECFNFCSYRNGKTGLTGGLKNNKRRDIYKSNKRNYH